MTRDTRASDPGTIDFDTFIDSAWSDHADDPALVAARLADGLALVGDEAQLARLATLVHHVHGEHLGDCHAGIAALRRLEASPAYRADGPSGATHQRCIASLALTAGEATALGSFNPSDRIRIAAMAAANLAPRDAARASGLFQQALDDAASAGLAADDPMNRALAVTGNNLACTLEEKPSRSGDERALMIVAAQAARHYWERAGTWLETERAEYRLAMTWLQAGDLALARTHAQTCLEIVQAHDGPALERLFGWEALGTVEKAAGNLTGRDTALAQARAAWAELDDGDKGWCAESLDKLAA